MSTNMYGSIKNANNGKRRLDGKVALVTGGARGIGKAIAIRLAEEGADVAINYQSTKKHAEDVSKMIDQIGTMDELEKLSVTIDQIDTKEYASQIVESLDSIGSHSYVCQANVSDPLQVDIMVKDVTENLGKIDILVNNAGIVRDKSFVKMTHDMWNEVMSVNLDGAFYCTKAVIGGMLEHKYGRVVNISSVIGRMGNRGQANYAASKAGMIGLTQSLAKEFATKGITVNAIAPGFIETDMLKGIPKNIMDTILAQIPMGRLGKPEDVAGAIAYLCSEDGDYITGQVFDVNGGLYI
jgi:3-oxoacyl-[acyl-carrier protein] reductase